MRAVRARQPGGIDLETLVDVLCDPDITPEREAEARQFVCEHFGPFADATLRMGGIAAAARRDLVEMQQRLERMVGGTRLRGIVTGVQNGHVRVQIGPTERIFTRPPELALGLGQIVFTDGGGQAVLGAGDYLVGGSTYAYCETLDDRYVLVRPLRDEDDQRQLALVADHVDLDALEPGDRVLAYSGLELGNMVLVTRRLGPVRAPVSEDVGVARVVGRDEIVGLEQVLARLERLFVTPPTAAYAALLEEADRAQVGALLVGPPGSGKSMIADHLVHRVRAAGGKALVRTASSYLSKWVGSGSARVRADLAALDRAWEETGVRPLLVIDEIEAIALDRSQGHLLAGGFLDVLDTLLALLTRTRARVIGISNVGDRYLDAALVRDGRLPIVRLPATLGPAEVARLVARCLARAPLASAGGAA
jgi:hypothetical protein